MSTIERSIDLEVPAATAYAAWTRFERFPEFMKDVESVEQIDDRRLKWRAKVFGEAQEWEAEISEQIPDKRIAWASSGGASTAGVVTFHRLADDRCRVMLQLEYEPDGWPEKIGDALGLFSHRVQTDLEGFKAFAERHGDEIQGWRGAIPSQDDLEQRASPPSAGTGDRWPLDPRSPSRER